MDHEQALAIFQQSIKQQHAVGDDESFHQALGILAADPTMAGSVLNSADLFQGKPYENEILTTAFHAAASSPDHSGVVIANHKLLAGKPYEQEILDIALPLSAKQPISSMFVIMDAEILNGRPDREELLKTAFYSSASNKIPLMSVMRGYGLLENEPYKDDLLKKTYLHAAETKSAHEVLEYLGPLENTSYRDEVLRTLTTTKDGADGIVSFFNLHHDDPPAKRFAGLERLDASQKYNLITQSRPDIYTSSYLYVMNSMLTDLKRENKQLLDVLSPEQMQRMSVFLEAAATYNRLDDALSVIPKDKLPQLIDNLAEQAGKSPDMSYGGAILALMTRAPPQSALLKQLEAVVKLRYENAATEEERDKFGIIASIYNGQRGSSISADEKSFYQGVAQDPRYRQEPTLSMERGLLVDKKGVCNQLMVFSHDEDGDGQRSFLHFRKTYEHKKDWQIVDKGDYIVVESLHSTGVPVRIYANKPEHFTDGIEQINKEVAQRQGAPAANIQVFVGRGHSFHFEEWLPHINSDMHLVHLGSCGGVKNEQKVVERDAAQIIATGQTGTMQVNDPLLFSINESIRTHGSINWVAQQTFLDNLKIDDKEAYLLPHRNLSATMLLHYRKLHGEAQPPQPAAAPAPKPQASNHDNTVVPDRTNRPDYAQFKNKHSQEAIPPREQAKPAAAKEEKVEAAKVLPALSQRLSPRASV